MSVRDPRAVISSLAARDGASFEFTNVLWLKYTLLAERAGRQRRMNRAFEVFRNKESELAARFARSTDLAFYRPGNEIAKWDSLGVRFGNVLSKSNSYGFDSSAN